MSGSQSVRRRVFVGRGFQKLPSRSPIIGSCGGGFWACECVVVSRQSTSKKLEVLASPIPPPRGPCERVGTRRMLARFGTPVRRARRRNTHASRGSIPFIPARPRNSCNEVLGDARSEVSRGRVSIPRVQFGSRAGPKQPSDCATRIPLHACNRASGGVPTTCGIVLAWRALATSGSIDLPPPHATLQLGNRGFAMLHLQRRFEFPLLAALVCGLWAQPASASPQGTQFQRNPQITPHMTGEAVYQDVDSSHTLGSSDRIVVRFDMPVLVLQPNASAFRLPVSGDSLGSGASIAAGPAADQVTIQLGSGATFRTQQLFSGANTALGAPSGIEINPAIPPGTIQSATYFIDAVNSGPVDLAAGWVLSTNVLDVGASRKCVIADANGDGAPDLFSQLDGTGLRLWENVTGTGSFYYF